MHILGIMSGSSLDGMDLALLRFEGDKFEWVLTQEVPYSESMKRKLAQLTSAPIESLLQIEQEFTQLTAETIVAMKPHPIDLIAWHGHTVCHRPEKGYTLAIGDADRLAQSTQIPVMNNFRKQNVVDGGQGAPLMHIVDEHFFKDYDAIVNLGGIANISIPKSKLAFDICGCNQLLNYSAQKLGYAYDQNGNLSKKGKVSPIILDQMNAWHFFDIKTPKSIDNTALQNFYYPLLESVSDQHDALSTSIEHITDQILNITKEFQLNHIALSGGGTKNLHLLNKLNRKSNKNTQFVALPQPWIDYKEAFLMAYMGYLRSQNKINLMENYCGGKDISAGEIYAVREKSTATALENIINEELI